jgi:hypothetical protein
LLGLIRSIWLASFFLVAIGALAAFKIARMPSADQHAAGQQASLAAISVADVAEPEADPAQKTNRLNVANADGVLERKSIQSIAIIPQPTTVNLKADTSTNATPRWRQRYARMSGRHRHHHHRHSHAA